MCHPSWGRARAAAYRLDELTRLRRVRDRLDREHARPLNVEALARGVNMAAGHLVRRFRQAYGASPYAYLTTRRTERAAALLRRGELTVTEVCFAVGWSSLGTFTARFTEVMGVPPDEYRRRNGGATAGIPACAEKRIARPTRRCDAPAAEPQPI